MLDEETRPPDEETNSPGQEPQYRTALRHLQQGEWDAGLGMLETLAARYPLDRELRNLRQEMQLRAQVDQDEKSDAMLAKRNRARRIITRLGLGVLALGVGFWGLRVYSAWFQEQTQRVNQVIQHNLEAAELATLFRDAQSLLQAGRLEESQMRLAAIAQQDPNYPGLQEMRAEITQTASLNARYDQAMQLIQQGDWNEAGTMLKALMTEAPNYRDVAVQFASVDKVLTLSGLLLKADAEFDAQHWTAAAAQFESIRALDSTYQSVHVEERLFRSYVESAKIALVGESDLLKAMGNAEAYFSKALALRPLDEEIKTQRELARLYLEAQSDYNAGRWDEVINDLEPVYAVDQEYALGTTRQTLYEAYVARGDDEVKGTAYDAALSDYQRAIDLAKQKSDAVLRLYEVNLKAADAERIKGNYEGAVPYYREAAELGRLRERGLEANNTGLISTLDEAEKFATAGNFGGATERYQAAFRIADADISAQATKKHVVQAGEYLILLASQNRSTVQAIVAANNIPDPRLIYVGQELIIPVLP